MTASVSSPSRSFWIDALKGLACMTIVWHHLAFYGPMSDVAAQATPALIGWLSEYGRIAVQVFLVMGGYLAAASLMPEGLAREGSSLERIGKRAMRLMAPYSVALLLAVLAAALVRPWFGHDSVPGQPSWHQLIANVLMLQDVTHEEALSAGVWYVAIDFQLFAATVLLLAAVRRLAPVSGPGLKGLTWAQGLVILATALSLLYFNLHAEWDMWFFYFMGSYGLGMLACWGQRSARPWAWTALLLALGLGALELEFRLRIAVALATAVALLWVMRLDGAGQASGRMAWRQWAPMRWLLALGQMSYSVFLVHFSVILLANAAMSHWFPAGPGWNWLGMLATFAASLAVGSLLYRVVETHAPNWRYLVRLGLGFVSTGLLVSLVSSRL
ncbi:MAG: acyltransferase family protein [Comamonas sp.]